MLVSSLFEAHFRQLLRLENQGIAMLLDVYRETQRELTERTQRLDQQGRGETFQAQHLALVNFQVSTALNVATARAADSFRQHFIGALHAGMRQGLAEVADLERRFGVGELAARVAIIPPVIPASSVAAIADPSRLLLYKYKATLETDVSRALSQSVVQGEGIGKAVKRLSTTMEGQRYQLERIARTEIANAVNAGHQEAIAAVADEFPEMKIQKQWSSHWDKRTSAICKHLDGEVKDQDKPFVYAGSTFMYPPAHPNCRSRCNPYSARWTEGKQQRSEGAKARDDARMRAR